ncbi:hypothetical protein PPYR_06207 [Photinus pyralis]|uniref:Carboxylic ester hydrolase n=6 Tax=Photinus pyralis TaxID=7054 RepID=A0A5N4AT15_PHOPY|nr:venom carboxylesterase-6-like isoform X2 [Photinus pyralis]XP_031338272.1 venom carboxylesterase-6-like isoform X2 [Photinus pyralis]XP_031338273.1 venom carboxylesterase-6-like isoform X2 [Photinus pyralis]XP_031338274.1 venom carboxylesterase-6-like isoform X2 [Photinus pyralis]XP_031353003.1 venom carboxylesterase-6-like [Photinus pyralis]XP_031353004.1 venom carboxylesterase-6-like [Photinus pyralis]XP_031353005.1 venom carboxylesterase-6-like [Photinus pyralis]XP_031353006.1 venom ca
MSPRADFLKVCCLIWTILGFDGTFADDLPLVQTSLGKIRGFHKSSFGGRIFSAFEGIPYAKPPVGALRFEAPQPVSPWDEVLNANVRYTCKQADNPFMPPDSGHNEDCLYLNVYVPKKQPSESDNYDVIVYIHGGAFMFGAASQAGPKYLMDRDVIFVSMNYRLGVLGFLTTEDSVVPGNNGLKDQQMALKWVQAHIKQFGGNPKSVTLMGLSAGGASVHFHFFSPQSKGLFHRAISQSGTVLMPWAIQESGLQKTRELAESLNCLDSDTRTLIDCLKAIPADDLLAKTNNFYHFAMFPLAPFAPTVEVDSEYSFLKKHPYTQLNDGDAIDVPWLTWIAKDEGILGAMFVTNMLDHVETNWNELSEHMFDYKHVHTKSNKHDTAHKIKSHYFKNEKLSESNLNTLVKVFSDRLFNVGFETAVHMQSDVFDSPVYAAIYAFDKSTALKELLGCNLEGVAHGAESVLLHDTEVDHPAAVKIELSESEILMKDLLIDFLISFASNGKPTSSGVSWEPLTTDNPKYLLLNDFDDAQMVEIPELSQKEFWEGLKFMENKRAESLREEL